jgi:hypothetical protein
LETKIITNTQTEWVLSGSDSISVSAQPTAVEAEAEAEAEVEDGVSLLPLLIALPIIGIFT